MSLDDVGGAPGGAAIRDFLAVSHKDDGTLRPLSKASTLVRNMVSETVMAAPPTVTIGDGTTDIASSVLTADNAASSPFRFEESFALYRSGNYSAPRYPVRIDGVAAAVYNPWRIAFDTDAPQFEFRTSGNGAQFRIWVNEQLVSASPTTITNDAADHLVLVDFTGVGGRAYRRIVLELAGGAVTVPGYFGGVRCLASDTLLPPMIPAGPRLGIFGDSYSIGKDGTLNSSAAIGYAAKLSHLLGMPNTAVYGAGGTGFLKDSSTSWHYLARISDLAYAPPDILLVQGSVNDSAVWTSGSITSAVEAFHAAVRASYPSIPVFYTGVPRPRSLQGNDASVEAEIKSTVATLASSDSSIYYINPHPTGAPAWFSGTGKAGSTTGDGNADFCLAADGTHPVAAGHEYLARRLAQSIASTLSITV